MAFYYSEKGIKYRSTAHFRKVCNALHRGYDMKKRSTPEGKISHRMEVALRLSLGSVKEGRKWEKLVGYTSLELKEHLESLFTEGMTWEKFIKGEIHIDHIIPKSHFKYTSTESPEFKKCWGLKNLQPLWAIDNLRKSNKLNYNVERSAV